MTRPIAAWQRHLRELPEHMQHPISDWILYGDCDPESFLYAVVSNDLRVAVTKADEINRAAILDIVKFFANHAPGACSGSAVAAAVWASQDHWKRPETRLTPIQTSFPIIPGGKKA